MLNIDAMLAGSGNLRPPEVDPDLVAEAIEEQLAIDSLEYFARYAWKLIEPGRRFVWNWHMSAICRELQAVSEGKTQRLVICVPPRHSKTLLVSVFWQAWRWLKHPEERVIGISKSPNVAKRSARQIRSIIKSGWYRRLLKRIARNEGRDPDTVDGAIWDLAADQNEKFYFENTESGYRVAKTVGSDITGEGADGLIIDDPYDLKNATIGTPKQVAKRMKEVVDIFDDTLESRLNDPAVGWVVLIMQRVHPEDIAGEFLKRFKVDHWEGLNCRKVILPARFEPDRDDIYQPDEINGFEGDPRTEHGEPLNPLRYPEHVLRTYAKKPRRWKAQHQHRPEKPGGIKFKEEWFQQRYSCSPERMSESLDIIEIHVDCAATKSDTADYTSIQSWGTKGRREKYLLDRDRGRWELPELLRRIRRMRGRWKKAVVTVIEFASNGIAACQTLKAEGEAGIVEYKPSEDGGKEVRAEYSVVAYEASEVYLPEREHAPWIDDYISEHIDFPDGDHDDDVDATSSFMVRRSKKGAASPKERLANMARLARSGRVDA